MSAELRLIDSYKKEALVKKGYKRSYEVRDENSGRQLACCDLCAYVESSSVNIYDENRQSFILKPNRKLFPTKWVLSTAQSMPLVEFERVSAIKMLNPLRRKLLTIRDLFNAKEYELKNLTDSKLDLMFGPSSLKWFIMQGDTVVAGLDRRKNKQNSESGKGVLSRIRGFMMSADWVLVSKEDSHLLTAPAFLSMMLLFESFTKSPA